MMMFSPREVAKAYPLANCLGKLVEYLRPVHTNRSNQLALLSVSGDSDILKILLKMTTITKQISVPSSTCAL